MSKVGQIKQGIKFPDNYRMVKKFLGWKKKLGRVIFELSNMRCSCVHGKWKMAEAGEYLSWREVLYKH